MAAPLIWLLVAGVLFALELAQPSFDALLCGALAALTMSALTALLPPLSPASQIGGFVVLTVVSTLWVSRWSAHRNPKPGNQNPREELADVTSAIAPDRAGRVRWHGQSWAATSLDLDRTMEPGDRVLVVGRDGNHLQVLAYGGVNQKTTD
ncbi:MAG: NfeD family protein [Synechococcus sp.]